jgi:hypothetical protein
MLPKTEKPIKFSRAFILSIMYLKMKINSFCEQKRTNYNILLLFCCTLLPVFFAAAHFSQNNVVNKYIRVLKQLN